MYLDSEQQQNQPDNVEHPSDEAAYACLEASFPDFVHIEVVWDVDAVSKLEEWYPDYVQES